MPLVLDIRNADDSRDVIHRAVQSLAEGGVVAFPTETVYGLAASALSVEGVARLAAAKQRPPEHPFSLAVKGVEEALDYVPDMSLLGRRLARRCWPGPVTLVFDLCDPESLVWQLPEAVQPVVIPGKSLGLRAPAHSAMLDVMRMLVGPLVLTGANRFGQPEARTAEELAEVFGDEVQLILDDGPCRFGQPSSIVHVFPDRFEVMRQGVCSEQALKRLASTMVVFVCTGNTCRSPMAESIFRDLMSKKLGIAADEMTDRGLLIMSAGLAAMPGARPSPEAVNVLAQQGLDLKAHESQPLTEQLVRQADYLITMTRSHRAAIVAEWPAAAERTFLLCDDECDVADPIGGTQEMYRRCADQIAEALKHWVEKIDV